MRGLPFDQSFSRILFDVNLSACTNCHLKQLSGDAETNKCHRYPLGDKHLRFVTLLLTWKYNLISSHDKSSSRSSDGKGVNSELF